MSKLVNMLYQQTGDKNQVEAADMIWQQIASRNRAESAT